MWEKIVEIIAILVMGNQPFSFWRSQAAVSMHSHQQWWDEVGMHVQIPPSDHSLCILS